MPSAATGILVCARNALGQENSACGSFAFIDQSFANSTSSPLSVTAGTDADMDLGQISVDVAYGGLDSGATYSFATDLFAYTTVHPTGYKPTQVWNFQALCTAPGTVVLTWDATTSALSFAVS